MDPLDTSTMPFPDDSQSSGAAPVADLVIEAAEAAMRCAVDEGGADLVNASRVTLEFAADGSIAVAVNDGAPFVVSPERLAGYQSSDRDSIPPAAPVE